MSPLYGLDRWLEEPYQRAYADEPDHGGVRIKCLVCGEYHSDEEVASVRYGLSPCAEYEAGVCVFCEEEARTDNAEARGEARDADREVER